MSSFAPRSHRYSTLVSGSKQRRHSCFGSSCSCTLSASAVCQNVCWRTPGRLSNLQLRIGCLCNLHSSGCNLLGTSYMGCQRELQVVGSTNCSFRILLWCHSHRAGAPTRPAEVSSARSLHYGCRLPNVSQCNAICSLHSKRDAATVPDSHCRQHATIAGVSKWLTISDSKVFRSSKARVRMPRHTTRPETAICDEKVVQK